MLPIRKVVLFKHGVGYFEREGQVHGDAAIDLHFRASEMNDVLKSLTVLDRHGGLVTSISYESTKPLERQLEDIAIRIPDDNALTGLLSQIKGARVALQVGSERIEGLITGTEQVTRKEHDATLWSTYLTLLVGGALRSFDLLDVSSIEFVDEALRKDLQHLLDILIGGKRKDLKRLTIFARGEGTRQLHASYMVESPVWKTSYRMLLHTEEPAILQGWALVDNTQDEDWQNVELSLVAGLPISFVHDLYSPRYKRRPVVQVQEEEAYAPPTLEGAVSEAADEMAEYRPAPPPPAPAMPMAMDRPAMLSRAAARRKSVQVQTRTVEVGDQFHYVIDNPVTVLRNQSALVPILQAAVEAQKVAVYNPEVRQANPMSAVLLKNSTAMTLEGGPMTVFQKDSYVGEAMLETMKPGEKRLVPYSVELGGQVMIDPKSQQSDVQRARIARGMLHLHRYRLQTTAYLIRNKLAEALDLFIEHRFQRGWDLVDTPRPEETTEHFYRFRVRAPAGQTTRFAVVEKGDDVESYHVGQIGREQLQMWIESRVVEGKTRELLEQLTALAERVSNLAATIERKKREVQRIHKDQERLRHNLQALGPSKDEKELRDRYVRQLAQEEDNLRDLQASIDQLEAEHQGASAELNARIHAAGE